MHILGVKKYIILIIVLILSINSIHVEAIQESSSKIKLYQTASFDSPLIGYLKGNDKPIVCGIDKQWSYINDLGFITQENQDKSCPLIKIDVQELSIYNNIAIGGQDYYLCQNQSGQDGWASLVGSLSYRGQINCHPQEMSNADNKANNEAVNIKSNIADNAKTTAAPKNNIDSKYLNASAWALKQVGKKYKDNGTSWDGWCDLFVASAYGRKYSGHNTAYEHYKYLLSKGWINTSKDVPVGGLAFFAPIKGNSAGHVIISIGEGNFVSSGKTVYITTLNMLGVGEYLGWSYDRNW